MNKKKLIVSLSIIGVVSAIAIGGTMAYFSDTENSTGNTFTAGTLDLKVDNTCHYDGLVCQQGMWVQEQAGIPTSRPELRGQSCACTWLEKDLTTGDLFFNFLDVKPGDKGENTISLTAKNNDAWLCAFVQNLVKNDNGCNEAEGQVDTGCGPGEGELQDNVYMTIWKDTNCDNVQDANETEILFTGPIDSNNGVWPLGQLIGDVKTCLGVAWNVPNTVGNIIQSDSVTGDISFYAEQVRNNPNFKCSNLVPQNPENAVVNGGFEGTGTCSFDGWTIEEAADSVTALGTDSFNDSNTHEPVNVYPREGQCMARLGTPGYSGQPVGNNTISQIFTSTGNNLSFLYNIYTYDYQGFDKFFYQVKVATLGGVLLANYSQTAWGPVGDSSLKTTGWQSVSVDLTGHVGEPIRIEITAGGTFDTNFNFWAYIDNVKNTP